MTDYDLVVVGAGIQGAAVAQAAAVGGYRVLVLEQFGEPALGTSSKSSKLIHGGLRYLETGQFSLVRECLRERKILLKNAPDLVAMKPFYIPVYRYSSRPSWKIALGLMIYSVFSKKRFYRLKKAQWQTLDGLNTDGLKAVYRYFDAQTDDAKLTAAVLDSACEFSTKVVYNGTFLGADISEVNCCIHYQDLAGKKTVVSHALVNAAGPWVDDTMSKIKPVIEKPEVELVQGAHIEIPGSVKQGIYYLEAKDKRAVFVMPWKEHLLVGTTENLFTGAPENVKPLQSEIDYLLSIYNDNFDQHLDRSDVINAFAGLRVLPVGSGAAFSKPRDTLLVGNRDSKPRVISLYGGKLTAHRATAEEVIEKLSFVLPEKRALADTETLSLQTR